MKKFSKGDKVKVLSGPYAGEIGTVELFYKKYCNVKLHDPMYMIHGNNIVRFESENLELIKDEV